jgi:hypothetical protein
MSEHAEEDPHPGFIIDPTRPPMLDSSRTGRLSWIEMPESEDRHESRLFQVEGAR